MQLQQPAPATPKQLAAAAAARMPTQQQLAVVVAAAAAGVGMPRQQQAAATAGKQAREWAREAIHHLRRRPQPPPPGRASTSLMMACGDRGRHPNAGATGTRTAAATVTPRRLAQQQRRAWGRCCVQPRCCAARVPQGRPATVQVSRVTVRAQVTARAQVAAREQVTAQVRVQQQAAAATALNALACAASPVQTHAHHRHQQLPVPARRRFASVAALLSHDQRHLHHPPGRQRRSATQLRAPSQHRVVVAEVGTAAAAATPVLPDQAMAATAREATPAAG